MPDAIAGIPDLASLPLFADEPEIAAYGVPGNTPASWTLAGHPAAPPPATAGPARSVPPRQQPAPPAATPAETSPIEDGIDWGLVRAFRQQAADRLSTALREREGLTPQAQRELGRGVVLDLLSSHADDALTTGAAVSTPRELAQLAAAVFDALFRLGRLQPLVDNPDVENIEITGCDHVLLEYSDGRLIPGPAVADSDEELIEALAFLASRSESNERPFSPANPTLHLRLDGGARLAASAWITPRPSVVIRRHRLRVVTLADLVARDMMGPDLAAFLAAAVKAKKSVVVSGPQGAGKTTLIRALASELGEWERIGTVETEYELHLHELTDQHRRITAWEARPGSGERGPNGKAAGEITLDDIIYDSFRFNLARILVGEVRGKEVLPMFKAMQGGAGSMSTTHAHSARAAIERLVTCAMEAGPHVTEQFAYRQIAEHIDLIVQIGLDTTGQDGGAYRERYITEVIAVEAGEHGRPAVTDVYAPGPDGRAAPKILPRQLAEDLARAGFSAAAFQGRQR